MMSTVPGHIGEASPVPSIRDGIARGGGTAAGGGDRRRGERRGAAGDSHHVLQRLFGFGALTALAVLLAQLAADNRDSMHERMARGRLYGHTLKILLATEKLRDSIDDCLQAERGYLLTDNEMFLTPLVVAKGKAPKMLDELERLSAGDPSQKAQINQLKKGIMPFLAFMDSEVALQKAGGHQAAIMRMRKGRGERLHAALDVEITRITADAQRHLVQRRASLDQSGARIERSLLRLVWGAAALLLVAFGAGIAVVRAQRKVRLLNRQLEVVACTDALTGLDNRRAFFEKLESAEPQWQPFALATIDIDHFKSVNDRFGHPAGDEALRSVAAVLKRSVRAGDVVARIGGEEFAILFAGLSIKDAEAMCEKLRAQVALLPIDVALAAPLAVTLSVGLATRRPDESGEALIGRADKALYRAKQEGRNQVRLAA